MITEEEQKELDRIYEMLDKNLNLLWEAMESNERVISTKEFIEDSSDMIYITTLLWKATIKE